MSSDTIYDHPRYYDILFGFDRSVEADFYERTLARCGVARGAPVLEVAAGPARVGRILARRGWRVTALDRSAAMLAFAREGAAAEGAPLATLCADMTEFRPDHPFAAAINPLSSFRLLHADAEVDAHLHCMAAALVPGGVYAIDLALQEGDGEAPTTDESWEASGDGVIVRAANECVTVVEDGRELRLAWGREAHLRAYTVETLLARVARSGLRVESWHREVGRPSGVSAFDGAGTAHPPATGRAMVVLRR